MGKHKNKKGKRSHAEYAHDQDLGDDPASHVGLATTLTQLKGSALLDAADLGNLILPTRSADQDSSGNTSGGWHIVGRPSKKHKNDRLVVNGQGGSKAHNSYPALTLVEAYKIQSMITINHLQNLLLYCVADGVAPNWISIRHHTHIKRAMVLLVPGLEKGMFDGTIQLEDTEEDMLEKDMSTRPCNGNTPALTEHGSSVASNIACHQSTASTQTDSSPDDYLPAPLTIESLQDPVKPMADIFTHIWPVKAPGDDRSHRVHSPVHAMLTSSIPKSKELKEQEKLIKGPKPPGYGTGWENTRTPITAYVASAEELRENDYTLHPVYFATQEEKDQQANRRQDAKQIAELGWIDTAVPSLSTGSVPDISIEKGSITAGRTIYALDCEMCKTPSTDMALTRVSLIDWSGTPIIDEFIIPPEPITDYLTPYSGITPANIASATHTLTTIQGLLLPLLTPHTILIGHSLDADLRALQITHPFVIDTSLLYPHPRGPPLKSSLKFLSQKYLSREIQKNHGTTGHDSIEDARACLDLVKLKCERGPKWGTSEASTEPIFKRLSRTPISGTQNSSKNGKIGAVVDHGSPERGIGGAATYSIGCANDLAVVEGVKRAVLGDEDGAYIPGGGVDFTFASLRGLEAVRGWSNHHPPPTPCPSLTQALSTSISHIRQIHAMLPPCTLFIVYSGTGDPREMRRLQDMQKTFREEYKVKKWDELSVRWTDKEEQALKMACGAARRGVGFMAVV